MAPTLLYTILALGALALYLIIRPGARVVKSAGAILGLAAFGWFLAATVEHFAPGERPEFFYTVFSVIAIAAAVRMITHPRPVYCALYFVMVVLASAALFLLLAAEFMAFALIIVYAGAILVTYMFVLMLAQQSPDPADPGGQAHYDRTPREPAAAAVVGFIMLALLGTMSIDGPDELDDRLPRAQATAQALAELNHLPRELERVVEEIAPGAEIDGIEEGRAVVVRDDRAFVRVIEPDAEAVTEIELSEEHVPGNVRRVGIALVAIFPVSLELAGIILLMAMFGAVVLARRHIELGEDELRTAAGLERVSGDEDHQTPGGGGAR